MNVDMMSILNGIDQYVFCKNLKGEYIYSNKQFDRIAGLNDGDIIIGKTDFDLIWRDQAQAYRLNDSEILAGSEIIRKEYTQKRGDGFVRTIVTKVPFRSDSGETIGILGNYFDCEGILVLETKGEFDKSKGRLYFSHAPGWLSTPEIEVCFYLIRGYQTQKISSVLGKSTSTVRYHIDNIKNKLQCAHKSEITEVAINTGLAWKILSLELNQIKLATSP
jgi:PAS domain S-box-containing protein